MCWFCLWRLGVMSVEFYFAKKKLFFWFWEIGMEFLIVQSDIVLSAFYILFSWRLLSLESN